jgi:hypothetical protein
MFMDSVIQIREAVEHFLGSLFIPQRPAKNNYWGLREGSEKVECA